MSLKHSLVNWSCLLTPFLTLAESASDQAKKEQTPGYTFTKSAIADLPSTAVQSIHIENDKPVEVDDEVFVWRNETFSGTKLPTKTKFKKPDTANKSTAPTTQAKQKTATQAAGAAKASGGPPPKTSMVASKISAPTGSQSKVSSADSKTRIKDGGSKASQTKVASGTRLGETRSKANSKTKVALSAASQEKATLKQNQKRGK